jgi:predicted enzyme related to lactoylglutathione lyase
MSSTTVNLYFAAVNIGCADPARLADFWGKVLGLPAEPGVTAPEVRAVGSTDPGSRPQMVFHPAPEAERIVGGFVPTLQTEHHEEEAKRIADLGATLVTEAYLPPIRLTIFADPEGNRFQLATFQPE